MVERKEVNMCLAAVTLVEMNEFSESDMKQSK